MEYNNNPSSVSPKVPMVNGPYPRLKVQMHFLSQRSMPCPETHMLTCCAHTHIKIPAQLIRPSSTYLLHPRRNQAPYFTTSPVINPTPTSGYQHKPHYLNAPNSYHSTCPQPAGNIYMIHLICLSACPDSFPQIYFLAQESISLGSGKLIELPVNSL